MGYSFAEKICYLSKEIAESYGLIFINYFYSMCVMYISYILNSIVETHFFGFFGMPTTSDNEKKG